MKYIGKDTTVFKKFMNGLSHPWVVGIATLCTIIAIIWSVFIWFVPNPTLLAGPAATPTPSTTQGIVSTPPSSPTPTPTPIPSPTPTSRTISKNIHLPCISGCYFAGHFDPVLTTIVIDQTTGSTTFNYTITYRNTTACDNEVAGVALYDDTGHAREATSGSMFENPSLTPGQTIQQTAVFNFVPATGSTYTLHTHVSCDAIADDENQAIALTF